MKIIKVVFDWSMVLHAPFYEIRRTPNSRVMFFGPVAIWWLRR